MADPEGATEAARRLAAAAESDNVYADGYLARAREVLADALSRAQHDSLRRIRHDIDQAVKQCRTATMLQDWKQVDERFGRDNGWGQRQQWTHFDGYQVLRNGQLRALAGGDVRYGGLNDLVSIELSDQRDGVIVRFAVIRRARHVARWL